MSGIDRLKAWSGALAIAAMIALPGPAPAQTVDTAARAALPGEIRQSGVLKVATSLQWPPFDEKSASGAPDGIDIRLVKAIAARLGLTPEFTDVQFPSIVPGVASGRFDIGVDQLADTAQRRQVVQFVKYYRSDLGLLVRPGEDISVEHLCGHSLALTQGSSQIAVAQALSKACVAAGNKPIRFLYYANSADTYLAVANGRGDGFLTDRAVGVYVATQDKKLAMAPGALRGTNSFSGIVIRKGNDQLARAIALAMQGMMADGSYKAILGQFGVPEAAIGPKDLTDAPAN